LVIVVYVFLPTCIFFRNIDEDAVTTDDNSTRDDHRGDESPLGEKMKNCDPIVDQVYLPVNINIVSF